MTEKKKEGPNKKRDGKIEVAKVFDIASEAYMKTGPDAMTYAVLCLTRGAVYSLQQYVEKGEGGIDWENPFVEVQYDVDLTPQWMPTPPQTELELFPAVKVKKDKVNLEDAQKMAHWIIGMLPKVIEIQFMAFVTHEVKVFLEEGVENGRQYNRLIYVPDKLRAELDALSEDDRNAKLEELTEGYGDLSGAEWAGTVDTSAGPQEFSVSLVFNILPLTVDPEHEHAFFPVEVGLDFTKGDPSVWTEESRTELWKSLFNALDELAAPFVKKEKAEGKTPPPALEPDRVRAVQPEVFPVAGGYVRPIFGLSEKKQDFPLLLEFYEPQTPLNWAVGLALFSLTDEEKVRLGIWQEASIHDLEDRVFCLTERDAPRRGDHRTDILAEVVKLHTTRNWYYEVDTIRVGRAWRKKATIGSQYAIPELQLVFLDKQTGERAFPTDAAVQALRVPLEVKGRRVTKPDGKDIPALPSGRWKLEALRWRWVQAFNEDLLLMPALEEEGKRKGLPKKTTSGKTIRKGYLIRAAENVFTALHRLRTEGPASVYAHRLLVMLAHNLNKTEDGIAADRVFRMLGIPEDYKKRTHEKPEDLVARAIVRLMQSDIGALLPTSDTTPRTDPNPDRRKGPYYRLIRSPEYTPRTGITSKKDAEIIEAEYAEVPPEPPALPEAKVEQAVFPGMEPPPAKSIPSGADIRAAREAAGLNLRRFAESIGDGSFNTWARYERGEAIRVGSIKPDTWRKVGEFVSQHVPPKGDL